MRRYRDHEDWSSLYLILVYRDDDDDGDVFRNAADLCCHVGRRQV